MKNTVAALLFSSLAKTCAFTLSPVSSAPPTKVATLNNQEKVITLSQGVALALECKNSNNSQPCQELTVQSDNPAIAETLLAYLGAQVTTSGNSASQQGVSGGTQPTARSALVVAAHAVGETTITVTTHNGYDQYTVHVLEH